MAFENMQVSELWPMGLLFFFVCDFLYKTCGYLFELHRQVSAIQMGTINISVIQLDQNQFRTFCPNGSRFFQTFWNFLGQIMKARKLLYCGFSSGWGGAGIVITISLAGIQFGHYWISAWKMSTSVAFQGAFFVQCYVRCYVQSFTKSRV